MTLPVCYFFFQAWAGALLFILGYLLTCGIAVAGLTAMEVVPKHMVGSAHGLAFAIAQGE
jgi:sugar phosphate permease